MPAQPRRSAITRESPHLSEALDKRSGPMVYTHLDAGQENSAKRVSMLQPTAPFKETRP